MKSECWTLAILFALGASACGVSQQKYGQAVRDAANARNAREQCSADLESALAASADANSKAAEAQMLVDSRDKALEANARELQFRQARIDGATAENIELRKELERQGRNVDAMLAEKGTLAGALADTKARLEELRKSEAAIESRAALFRQLALRLHKMVDAGQLAVVLRQGRMVIRLPNDVLFDSGQTVIKSEGREALALVASVLQTIPARRFQVAGDTDNVPIQTARFPSNWELSTARAVEVVRFLTAHGMAPELLSASGYGEFDPIAPNDTEAGRRQNRRIEIVLQPNIDELVGVPEAG
ncbi:MAG TPA: OmpA family protein [Polyangiaceae bacterium]|nr:OmpA family protein [Polyangiaceae bacterium]